jgi:polysaccharide export outer membrane protein
LCGLAVAACLAGCDTSQPQADQPYHSATPKATPTNNLGPLRVGDRVRVELSGTPDPIQPIEQDIAADGSINLPFIGHVPAEGKTPGQVQNDIQALYVPAWYKHINVTVTPPMRFFFVGGQVNNSGSGGGRILYSGPITVTGAIQAAGDFTPFANKKKVQLTRVDGTMFIIDCVKALKRPELDLPVYPGDKIYVPRRFW